MLPTAMTLRSFWWLILALGGLYPVSTSGTSEIKGTTAPAEVAPAFSTIPPTGLVKGRIRVNTWGEFDPVALAKQLIAEKTVTPQAGRCWDMLEEILKTAGFWTRRFAHPDGGTALYAQRGTESPHLCFVTHLDVPEATEVYGDNPPPQGNDFLKGAGAAHKGALAAFIAALLTHIKGENAGTISLFLSSNSGRALSTPSTLEWLHKRLPRIDVVLLGTTTPRGTLINGRYGRLYGTWSYADHVSTEALGQALKWMRHIETQLAASKSSFGRSSVTWTDWHISPENFKLSFVIHYAPCQNFTKLKKFIEKTAKNHLEKAIISVEDHVQPYWTQDKFLLAVITAAMRESGEPATWQVARDTDLYGTLLSPLFDKKPVRVVEYGLEGTGGLIGDIKIADLKKLSLTYQKILEHVGHAKMPPQALVTPSGSPSSEKKPPRQIMGK